jgi:hypothetical protein
VTRAAQEMTGVEARSALRRGRPRRARHAAWMPRSSACVKSRPLSRRLAPLIDVPATVIQTPRIMKPMTVSLTPTPLRKGEVRELLARFSQ